MFSKLTQTTFIIINFDNRISENVENIWRNHKIHNENHRKLESRTSDWRINLGVVKMHSSNDNTQLYTYTIIYMRWFNFSCAFLKFVALCAFPKLNHLMQMDNIKIFAKKKKKWKGAWNSDTNNKNIQLWYTNGI